MTPALLHLHIDLPRADLRSDDNILAPFQSFQLLRSLDITALAPIRPYFVHLFDKQFGEWPALETATFEFKGRIQSGLRYGSHGTTPPTRSLVSQTSRARDLSFYHVAACDSFRYLLDSPETINHNLAELKITFLEIGQAPPMHTAFEVKEAILFARSIDHLYPNLKRIDICDEDKISICEPWYRAVEMIVRNGGKR